MPEFRIRLSQRVHYDAIVNEETFAAAVRTVSHMVENGSESPDMAEVDSSDYEIDDFQTDANGDQIADPEALAAVAEARKAIGGPYIESIVVVSAEDAARAGRDRLLNSLRLLASIDKSELRAVGAFAPDLDGMWPIFRGDPFRTLMKASDDDADRIWRIIQERQPERLR
jgi:hypothetical protein